MGPVGRARTGNQNDRDETDGDADVGCELVVAGCNAAEVLQSAEHALAGIAIPVAHLLLGHTVRCEVERLLQPLRTPETRLKLSHETEVDGTGTGSLRPRVSVLIKLFLASKGDWP